uniref:PABS domain-containing protein n=1 Tax=Paramoeba aestuarina TaxID=180227 RepID=A0A7S4PKV4_9EUKA|mmetsp:Transcript_824/g.1387  ORF Transcript_824/g.1387 Transcript_824/m.1387 type:complete len:343 (+) Transcript_824:160-1188(+)
MSYLYLSTFPPIQIERLPEKKKEFIKRLAEVQLVTYVANKTFAVVQFPLSTYPTVETIHSSTTKFQLVEIFRMTDALGSIDYALYLNEVVQWHSREEPFSHELMVLIPAMLCHSPPKRVLILGGGDGLPAREALRIDSIEHVRVVELDDELIEFTRSIPTLKEKCKDSFGKGVSNIGNVVAGDALNEVNKNSTDAGSWDLVIDDCDYFVTDQPSGVALANYKNYLSSLESMLRPGGVGSILLSVTHWNWSVLSALEGSPALESQPPLDWNDVRNQVEQICNKYFTHWKSYAFGGMMGIELFVYFSNSPFQQNDRPLIPNLFPSTHHALFTLVGESSSSSIPM